MKTNRIAGLGVLLAAALIAQGCSFLGVPIGTSKPLARFVGLSLGDIGLDAATVNLGVELENTMRQALSLAGVEYSLASAGNPFIEGKTDVGEKVAGGASKRFDFPVRLRYADVLDALSGVKPGAVVPYDARLALKVDGPFGMPIKIPLKKSGQLPVPTMPEVRNVNVEWDQLNLLKAKGKVRLELVNRNQFPVTLSNVDYAMRLGDVQVARSSLARKVSFDADGGAGLLEIPIEISPAQLGLAAVQMLGGSDVKFDLEGMMKSKTPFGDMALPLRRSGEASSRGGKDGE